MQVSIADEEAESPGQQGFRKHIDQEMRIVARSLFYRVKVTLGAISSGAMSPTAALFPYFVLPKEGITVAEKQDWELDWLIESEKLAIPAKATAEWDGGDITRRD